MPGLADLLRQTQIEPDDSTLPLLMAGTIVDVDPLLVTVPAIDGGRDAVRAFGTLPSAAPDDKVAIMRDEFGGLVVVAWEAA